jgi:hypothetical protein
MEDKAGVSQASDNRGARGLPNGVIHALSENEKTFCDQWLGSYRKGCREVFRQNLWWREIRITPFGKSAVLVESRNMSFCGSAGCSIYLFTETSNGTFKQYLGKDGDVGSLVRFKVLETITDGHYDLQKTWADGSTRTTYKWNGKLYSAVAEPE